MKWTILADDKKDILATLLANRGINSKKAVDDFLNPPEPLSYTSTDLLINSAQLKKAITRIRKAIKTQEPIVVYGDYDADGICATAIMWEVLRDIKAQVLPFIPQREKESYGLTIEGIDSILADEKYGLGGQPKSKTKGLIITVDSGVVAHKAVDYANKLGIDVIVIDHHEKPKKLPKSLALIHTTKLCASGLAYFVARELKKKSSSEEDFLVGALELAAIATITDLVPLVGPNRSIVRYGLKALNKTTRPGLKALFTVAGIKEIGTYEIGYVIGPRLNASGRIESALTALRLLCTTNHEKAQDLAEQLNTTNRERQDMVVDMAARATTNYELRTTNSDRIIVMIDDSYHQGIIGLIAGKLVERYYLPAIVIARGEKLSKASARSISGFNIIEAIRTTEDILVNAGGHPMAAGFTIENEKIQEFESRIKKVAAAQITTDMLEKSLRVDTTVPVDLINFDLYELLSKLAPFGLGNPEPVFASKATVQSFRTVGAEGKHLKLTVSVIPSEVEGSHTNNSLDAIAFNHGAIAAKLKVGEEVNLAYSVALDTFNGNHKLQLKIRDIDLGKRTWR